MAQVLNLGDILAMNALHSPDKLGARDLTRSMSFSQWNDRACRLANGLLGLGLRRGDRFAVLAYNCIEWFEIYAAAAKSGLIVVPVNFRLVPAEVLYILEDAEISAVIVQDELVACVESIRGGLHLTDRRYVHIGAPTPGGYTAYEALLVLSSDNEPFDRIPSEEPFAFLYTSGTTGRPKGAVRTNASLVLHAYLTQLEFKFDHNDLGLLVMPMCHANSIFFAFAFACCGAPCCVYDRRSFDPEHLLRVISEGGFTFTSLVPTHYIMMLGLPEATKARADPSRIEKLLISSAPARRDTKLDLMGYFRNSKLFEAYGSTEMGFVTILRPDEQLTKLGSIGREHLGTARIRLIGADGAEVQDGEAGEIYSLTPYAFTEYWKLPQRTAEAFRDGYCTVGDLARRDGDGYYYLVDRKSNMIISGGENVYPSEVEQVVGAHPKVKDVAVIGVPHEMWGESVHAVVILHDTVDAAETELLDWCRDRIAGYKRPRSITFVRDEEMPRTATGKILHRVLRDRIAKSDFGCAVQRG